jgi:hypothetical protein
MIKIPATTSPIRLHQTWLKPFKVGELAKRFGISYNTLKRTFLKSTPDGILKEKPGPRALFSTLEEEGILEWVNWKRKSYMPPSIRELRAKVLLLCRFSIAWNPRWDTMRRRASGFFGSTLLFGHSTATTTRPRCRYLSSYCLESIQERKVIR